MKEIKLTQNQVALVDDDMFEYLNQWKWYALKSRNTFYAKRTVYNPNTSITMHRLIMNTPKGIEVDHRDHSGLNNQKNNLRNCTGQQNRCNRLSSGKIKYLGVSLSKNLFKAQIKFENKTLNLGRFKSEIEAAKAYDLKAIELHGEFANLNFK